MHLHDFDLLLFHTNKMTSLKTKYTHLIKTEASRLGFSFCGIAKAGYLEEEAPHLAHWLNNKMHGKMHYMENNFDKRLDPTKLVEGSKSVISLMYNYFPEQEQRNDTFKISKYAYGKDYHFVVKHKLKDLVHFIQEHIGAINARVFTDSAPVLERAWAKKSGLGWIGKNGMLINKQQGSFFFFLSGLHIGQGLIFLFSGRLYTLYSSISNPFISCIVSL